MTKAITASEPLMRSVERFAQDMQLSENPAFSGSSSAFWKNKRLLLAVSGGLDSACMWHFFRTYQEQLGVAEIAVFHADHGLRGAESAADYDWVQEQAQIWNTPFWGVRLKLDDKQGAVEERARHARYRELLRIYQSENYDLALTAHTLNDQAETLHMRLARGTGLRGLRGILALRDDGIARPLLACSRSVLESYAREHAIEWREDLSNQDFRFTRNRIRHQELPAVQERATLSRPPAGAAPKPVPAETSLESSPNAFSDASLNAFQDAADPVLSVYEQYGRIARLAQQNYPRVLRQAQQLWNATLLDEPSEGLNARTNPHIVAWQSSLLHEILEQNPGSDEELFLWVQHLLADKTQTPGVSVDLPLPALSEKRWQQWLGVLHKPGMVVDWGKNLILRHNAGVLSLEKAELGQKPPFLAVFFCPGDSVRFEWQGKSYLLQSKWSAKKEFTLYNADSVPLAGEFYTFFAWNSPEKALCLRQWQNGDLFSPPAVLAPERKLKKYLAEQKIMPAQRRELLLVTAAASVHEKNAQNTGQEVIWIPNWALSSKYALKDAQQEWGETQIVELKIAEVRN
jgi:tRNA(Ile)-lysidine synthetase-like protein